MALHTSIITACIPSIKRFFADVQSGLMGVTISEQYEVSVDGKNAAMLRVCADLSLKMTHSGGKTHLQSHSGTGVGSRITSRFARSRNRSQAASGLDSQAEGETYASAAGDFGSKSRVKATMSNSNRTPETESVKGLTTNAIHQKIDYEIEYEERESEGRLSR